MLQFENKGNQSNEFRAGFYGGYTLTSVELKPTKSGENFLKLNFSKNGKMTNFAYFLPKNFTVKKDGTTKELINQFRDFTRMSYSVIYSLYRFTETFHGGKKADDLFNPITSTGGSCLKLAKEDEVRLTDELVEDLLVCQRQLVERIFDAVVTQFEGDYSGIEGVLLQHYKKSEDGTKAFLTTPQLANLSPMFGQYKTRIGTGTISPFYVTEKKGYEFTSEFVVKAYVNKEVKEKEFTILDFPLVFDNPFKPTGLALEAEEVEDTEEVATSVEETDAW